MIGKTKTSAKILEEKKNINIFSKKGKTHFFLSKSLSSPFDQNTYLQRAIGNLTMQRLFKDGIIQAKLKISQPGDKYEQEADRVVEQVMRMTEPLMKPKPT